MPMMKVIFLAFCILTLPVFLTAQSTGYISDPAVVFNNPPDAAKPGVLWMWMGSNISKSGITRDLEALKKAGFSRTTMFSLADVTTPWAGEIGKSPTPEIIAWTEPWWKMVRHAAEESKRLGMDFGMFNGPGYEASGGPWITPELSMQEISWSADTVSGNGLIRMKLKRPQVDPHANQLYPVFNPETGLVENPVMEARKTYYKDISIMAVPVSGIISKNEIINLSDKTNSDGSIEWMVPPGNWIIYRFGHTTRGTLIQPAQWKATGMECDKMSKEAVEFHVGHVIKEIQNHLGDLIGTGFTHVHFDSYEAGDPTWTPKMREEFSNRRGYDLVPYLPCFAGRIIDSKEDSARFMKDFDATIKDLHRDIYFTTLSDKLKEAGLIFLCEPYGGPWRQDDVMPLVHKVMTEFWTHDGKYSPYELDPTVAALRKSGQNIIEAEAFTGAPAVSQWSETPEWLKPIGDAAFCAGVNRFILHRFVQQPWADKYLPGATMGRWGTHFDRTQTWWEPAKAMVEYWQRCQALLQWGRIADQVTGDFNATTNDSIEIRYIHRKQNNTNIYFVANTSRNAGIANCQFRVTGMQPELWDPVTGSMRTLNQFTEQNGSTTISIPFAKAQSFFIVFRDPVSTTKQVNDFPELKEIFQLSGSWFVSFDSVWGGPAKPVLFHNLQDWTKHENKGIRYFSGTAKYKKTFSLSTAQMKASHLDLGIVKHIAHVKLNGRDLGVIWTAPWQIALPAGLLKRDNNILEIDVTNVWANRLIGDEQEPSDTEWLPGHIDNGKFLKEFPNWFLEDKPRPSKGRICFTTWNYFTQDSPLISSGLLGPVKFMAGLK
jgi:hypothetical protein